MEWGVYFECVFLFSNLKWNPEACVFRNVFCGHGGFKCSMESQLLLSATPVNIMGIMTIVKLWLWWHHVWWIHICVNIAVWNPFPLDSLGLWQANPRLYVLVSLGDVFFSNCSMSSGKGLSAIFSQSQIFNNVLRL